jgi:molybdate transport repressor ModE-like protein
MDKLTSMKVFSAIVQAGSFSAAAREMNISRAMATKHVQYLEDLLGTRLLNRTNRRLKLTEAGQAYRERCARILTDIEETERAVTELNARPGGTLKLTAPTSFGTFYLVPAINDYALLHPEVKVQLALNDQLLDPVAEGLDLVVRVGRLKDSNLIARRLASSRVAVCGAPAYFLKHPIPQTPEDLAGHNCLLYTEREPKDEWEFTRPGGGTYTVQVAGDFEASNADAARMAALGGRGLVQLPSYVVGADIKRGRLQAVLHDHEPEQVPIHVIYPHRRHLSATVRTFVDFLMARFEDRQGWEAA